MSLERSDVYRIGVDIGGTFTDVVVASDEGEIVRAKALTTPGDYTEGVVAALANAAERLDTTVEALIADCASFVNGTTVVTNAIAQRRGRRVGLLTTAGFRQQIYIHRGVRQVQLDLQKDLRPPDILRLRHVAEIHERIDRAGTVLLALDPAEVEREVRRLVEDEGVEALGICFLWSFRNPGHERAAREVIASLYPDLFVTVSSEIYPRIREYERMNTALLNAYVSEGAETYISKLARELETLGLEPGRLAFMQSLGGHISGAEAVVEPIQLSHSGPVGGVVAASHFASQLGEQNIITADLGGTSFDTALIRGGRATYAHRTRINRLLTGLSTIDIHAIGAGGGSIAWIDQRGIPQMGPHSAGADPGPACYGRGGTEATITDANLILGLIDPLNFWGGAVTVDVEAARQALQPLAEQIGSSVEQFSAGLHEIAVTQIATAMATVSLGRGHDPRDFAVIGFGGASGLFLAEVCQQLGIRKLIMPRAAATFSAYGLLFADAVHSFATTAEWNLQAGSMDEINALYARLEEQARGALAHAGYADEDVTVAREADLKWVSQSFEISMTMPAAALEEDERERLIASFVEEYERVYGAGTAWHGFPIQLHTARVVGIGKTPKPPIPEATAEQQEAASARGGMRRIRLTGGELEAAVYAGPGLVPGMTLAGPALIDDVDTTLYVPEGVEVEIDRFSNYVFQLGETALTPESLALAAATA
jgi:N-methylhydantoinase A